MNEKYNSAVIDMPTKDFVEYSPPSSTSYASYRTSAGSSTEIVNLDNSVVPTESNFEKFTDRQKITFETSPISKYILDERQIHKYKDEVDDNGLHHIIVNRTIKDITTEMLTGSTKDQLDSREGYWIDPNLAETLQNTEGSDSIVIEEVIQYPDTGFDAVLVRDSQGNLRLYYSCTDDRNQNDLIHDGLIGVMANSNADEITGKLGLNIDKYTQKEQAELAAEYCYQKIKEERAAGKDVQLSMSGYSLGGGNCEFGYLSLYKNHSDVKDIVNGLNLTNPLHGGLTSEEAKIIKGANNFSMYANETDFVHTINNYDDFKDVQQLYFSNKHWKDDDSSSSLLGLAGNISHQITSLNFNDDYMNVVFDTNGNLRTADEKGNGPHAYDSKELFKLYYGYSYTDYYQLAHQAIDEFVPDFGCELLGDLEFSISDILVNTLNVPLTALTTDFSNPNSIIDSFARSAGNIINAPVHITTDVLAMLFDIPGLLSYVPEGENFFFDALHNVGNFFNGTGDFIQNIGNHVSNFVDDTAHNVGDFIKDTGAAIYDNVIEPVGNFFSDAAESVGDFFSDPIGTIGSWFG